MEEIHLITHSTYMSFRGLSLEGFKKIPRSPFIFAANNLNAFFYSIQNDTIKCLPAHLSSAAALSYNVFITFLNYNFNLQPAAELRFSTRSLVINSSFLCSVPFSVLRLSASAPIVVREKLQRNEDGQAAGEIGRSDLFTRISRETS